MILNAITLTMLCATAAASEKASLWDRLGGLEKIKPMLEATVDLHFDDPLTGDYFGPHKYDNDGTRPYVKKQVLHFFSAGVGGPYNYSGKDMVAAHAKMRITDTAFHALSYHLLTSMKKFQTGGLAEREEALAILYSMKSQVQSQGRTNENTDNLLSTFRRFITSDIPGYLRDLPVPDSIESAQKLTLDDALTVSRISRLFKSAF